MHIAQQEHAKCAPVYLIKDIENTTDQHAVIVIADRAVWIVAQLYSCHVLGNNAALPLFKAPGIHPRPPSVIARVATMINAQRLASSHQYS